MPWSYPFTNVLKGLIQTFRDHSQSSYNNRYMVHLHFSHSPHRRSLDLIKKSSQKRKKKKNSKCVTPFANDHMGPKKIDSYSFYSSTSKTLYHPTYGIIRILGSGKILLLESEILGFGIWNTAQGIRTPWRVIQNPRLSLARLCINGNGTFAPFAIKFMVCVM